MKHLVAKTFTTLLFSALLFLGIAPNAQAQPSCSSTTLSGSFGYTNTGTILVAPSTQIQEASSPQSAKNSLPRKTKHRGAP